MLLTPTVRSATDVIDTTCSYCALQCGIQVVRGGEPGEPLAVRPRRGFPANSGILCAKGLSCVDELHHPDPLLTPLIRRGGALAPSTWDEALELTAGSLRAIRALHGSDAVDVYAGGVLTNEKSYLVAKWARLALSFCPVPVRCDR